MLSEEEMRRIETEELALAEAQARAEAQEREQVRRRLAEQSYRQEVRAMLRPRPWWWPLRWLLLALPIALLSAFLLRPASPTPAEDVTGGISTADFIRRCQEHLTWQQGDDLPNTEISAAQVTSDADGKRLDGTYRSAAGNIREFTCTYTAADGLLSVQLMEEP